MARGRAVSALSRSAMLLLAVGALCSASAAPIRHSTTANGARFTYTAELDSFSVSEPGHPPGATVTTIAYTRNVKDRPVVFAFNGGPGASSLFLHMGVLGPQRIELPADVEAPRQPSYPLVHNDDSILDQADVVLIDPPGTGFSRLTDEKAEPYFYSVAGDAQVIADAIERWSRLHGRTTSAKYILGESYGAVRAVEVGRLLLARPGQAETLRGIVLVSPSLAILETVQRRSNIVGYAAGLKTMAITAWYHKRAGQGQPLQEFAQRAETFAANEWLPALMTGSALEPARKESVASGLASLTGISRQYLIEHDLYLGKAEHRRLLLADRGLIVGESDSRYVGPAASGSDPSSILMDAMRGAAPDLLRAQLGVDNTSDYVVYVPKRQWVYINQPFDIFNREDYASLDYIDRLQRMMAEKPDLQVFVAGGLFDTTASAGAQVYQTTRGGLDLKRFTIRVYDGGHMFYTDTAARKLFSNELREFVLHGSQHRVRRSGS